MYTGSSIFPCISWKRLSLTFFLRKKISCFWGKSTIFPDSTRKIMSQRNPFWKDHLFRTFEENITLPCIFLRKASFIFCLTGKIIFSGRKNIIFPDNKRKIVFQDRIFSKDHLFRTSGKRKYGFPCSAERKVLYWLFQILLLQLLQK